MSTDLAKKALEAAWSKCNSFIAPTTKGTIDLNQFVRLLLPDEHGNPKHLGTMNVEDANLWSDEDWAACKFRRERSNYVDSAYNSEICPVFEPHLDHSAMVRQLNHSFRMLITSRDNGLGYMLRREDIQATMARYIKKEEDYHVYGSLKGVRTPVDLALRFGIVKPGVHLTARSRDETGAIRIHHAIRSNQEAGAPGLFDNIAAGGIRYLEDELMTLALKADQEVKNVTWGDEDDEKALEAAQKQANMVVQKDHFADWVFFKGVYEGMVTYYQVKDEAGGAWANRPEPGIRFVFSIEVPRGFKAEPGKEGYEFMPKTADEIMDSVWKQKWKRNSGMLNMHFLIRNCHVLSKAEDQDVLNRYPFRSDGNMTSFVLEHTRYVPGKMLECGDHLNLHLLRFARKANDERSKDDTIGH